MEDSRAKILKQQGDNLFSKKKNILSLWQNIAENFYPERADFTMKFWEGKELATNLTTSYPVMTRRNLAEKFSSMLRPSDKQWFFMRQRGHDLDSESLKWLDFATETMTRAMYDPVANFVRATKEGDNDFSAFGQCVISIEMNRKANALLYRSWHLKDVAWCEGVDGRVNEVHRNWNPEARQLVSLFKDKVDQKVKDLAAKDPYATVNCRHCVVPSDGYEGEKKYNTPYVSIYYDCDNGKIIEETGSYNLIYVIPRWQTVAGSQYAYSPAVVAALADARLLQQMTLTLLEAGEKAVNPPMVATQEALRSDIAIYAGGVTFVDAEYDERLGEVLRPLTQDKSGIPLGIEMQRDVREQIAKAFYLDRISLPPMQDRTTAYEMSTRVSEYIRNALPLFEPMETEYNGAMCEVTFDLMLRNGGFGPISSIPEGLRGLSIPFVFESPLTESKQHVKSQKLLETKAVLASAAELDPSVLPIIDVGIAVRDVLTSGVAPNKWIRSEDELQNIQQQKAQAAQLQQTMQTIQQGGQAAGAAADAGVKMQQLMGQA